MFVPWGFVICLVCAGLAAALAGGYGPPRELSWIKTLGLARKRNCQEMSHFVWLDGTKSRTARFA
jgi:hypothetical protein